MAGTSRYIIPLVCFTVALVPKLSAETIEAFTEPYQEVELAAGDSGIISEVLVKPGDSIKEGQLLVSLDNRVLRATLSVAEKKASVRGAYDAAKAELKLRQERLQQIHLLRQRGHATQRELSRTQTDADVAEARVRQAEDELALAELDCQRIKAQIAQRQIVSPFEGVITELHRKVGEPTLVTEPRIVTLSQLDRLRVKFSATPNQVAKLKEDQTLQLALAATNERIEGKIERISQTIDAKSGTVEVHVVINNDRDQVRSGARCLLELETDHTDESITQNASRTDTVEAGLLVP